MQERRPVETSEHGFLQRMAILAPAFAALLGAQPRGGGMVEAVQTGPAVAIVSVLNAERITVLPSPAFRTLRESPADSIQVEFALLTPQ